MKIKGAELQQFVNSAWPTPEDDWFWDHEAFEEINAQATYETDDLGPIQYQGSDSSKDPTRGDGYDIARLIRAWRKSRTTDSFIVEVPKDQVEAFKTLMKERGFPVKAGY